MITIRSATALAVMLGLAALTQASATEPACNRDCLQGIADNLLVAIVAHDPSRLRIASTYMATENSVPSALGMMSVFQDVTAARGKYYVIDPTSQQVLFVSTVAMGAKNTLLFGRLRVASGLLSEIELYTLQSRGESGFMFSPDLLANLPAAWTDPVAPPRRASRAELLQAGRSIFDSRVAAPDISPNCFIFENGKLVAEDPEVVKWLAPPEPAAGSSKPIKPNADGTMPIPCGSPPQRPVDSAARTDLIDEQQGVVVSIGSVHGIVEPYLVKTPTESAYVPDSLLKPYADMLRAQQQSGKFTAPSLRPMPASQVVVQLYRIYDGKLQGMIMLQRLGATGSTSPWVRPER